MAELPAPMRQQRKEQGAEAPWLETASRNGQARGFNPLGWMRNQRPCVQGAKAPWLGGFQPLVVDAGEAGRSRLPHTIAYG